LIIEGELKKLEKAAAFVTYETWQDFGLEVQKFEDRFHGSNISSSKVIKDRIQKLSNIERQLIRSTFLRIIGHDKSLSDLKNEILNMKDDNKVSQTDFWKFVLLVITGLTQIVFIIIICKNLFRETNQES
jgi:hypothetical protein